ncbi:hypothetical protein MBLNU230_g8506t1 [Neophaeotheca triangularis]
MGPMGLSTGSYTKRNPIAFQSSCVSRTCPGTDYVGTSYQVVGNTANAAACVQLCARDTANACDKSVYDTQTRDCHLKGSDTYSLRWTTNARFTSSRRVTTGNVGRWGQLVPLPVIPVAAYVVPTQPERVLFFSAWGAQNFGGAGGLTQFADYNWRSGAVSARQVANTNHDMFCPGISSLQDGRIVITGGSDAQAVSIYNPANNQFTRGPNMRMARGYQSSTILSDGRIFTIGGSYSGGIRRKAGEVYDPQSNTWTMLPGADARPLETTDREGAWRIDNHAWLFPWSDGSVFQAGPSKAMNWYSTKNGGSVQAAGTRETANDAMCGVNVMYDAGKIFAAGGSQDYTNSAAFNRAFLITITTPNTPATVERLPAMRYPRGFANVVVLPDGKVLITGGQKRSLVFTNTDSSLPAELFDPVTKTFSVLAEEARPRNYHSVSILLADGTVFSGGGGLCYVGGGRGGSDRHCDRSVDHLNGQIFSPPYLFNNDGTIAIRPVISSAPSNARVGTTITLQMSNSNTGMTFSLVRMGSVTHSINIDQRRLAMRDVAQSGNSFTIRLPSDSGVLLPGYYYLFGMNQAGVPSVASVLQIRL